MGERGISSHMVRGIWTTTEESTPHDIGAVAFLAN